MIEIPCIPNGISHWTQRTQLDGRDYLLTFDWNQRGGLWVLLLADQDGNEIISTPLLTNFWVLRGKMYDHPELGQFVVIDTSTLESTDPAFDSLGTRHKLIYVPVSELT